jgi:hypothetical protein
MTLVVAGLQTGSSHRDDYEAIARWPVQLGAKKKAKN